MKVVNANKLKRFWENGVLARIDALGKKIDVLDTKEEIEANTDAEKMAGALAVKEMFGQLDSNLSKRQVDFTLASGIERVAGFSWIRSNVVCLSTCLKITKNITANTNIITAMKVAGVPINVEWTYGICKQGDKSISLVAMNSIVYVEENLLTANGEYIIISGACVLQ